MRRGGRNYWGHRGGESYAGHGGEGSYDDKPEAMNTEDDYHHDAMLNQAAPSDPDDEDFEWDINNDEDEAVK
jgi:hypothetical protein